MYGSDQFGFVEGVEGSKETRVMAPGFWVLGSRGPGEVCVSNQSGFVGGVEDQPLPDVSHRLVACLDRLRRSGGNRTPISAGQQKRISLWESLCT